MFFISNQDVFQLATVWFPQEKEWCVSLPKELFDVCFALKNLYWWMTSSMANIRLYPLSINKKNTPAPFTPSNNEQTRLLNFN